MLHREICGGAAFYTRGPVLVCDKVANRMKCEQFCPLEPVQTAGHETVFSSFPQIWIAVPPAQDVQTTDYGGSKERGSPMRVFAIQQLAFVATAAAFLFLAAIVAGLI